QDREARGRRLRVVAKAVHHAALDEHALPGPDLDIAASDPKNGHAGEAVDRLVPALMMMRHRHAGVRLQRHLEDVDAAAGLVLALQKAKLHPRNAYDLRHEVWSFHQ